jgi:hypothetical protein
MMTSIKMCDGAVLEIVLSEAVLDMFPHASSDLTGMLDEECDSFTEAMAADGSLTIYTDSLNYIMSAMDVVSAALWFSHHADQDEELLMPTGVEDRFHWFNNLTEPTKLWD